MMKRTPLVALALAAVASFSVVAAGLTANLWKAAPTSESAGSLEASWAYSFSSFEDLSAASSLVVIGKVGSSPAKVVAATDTVGSAGISLHFTDWPFDVSKVLKGPAAPSVVVRQTGAVLDGTRIEIRDDPLFESDREYLLFLSFDAETGTYMVVGGPQGRLEVRGGRVSSLSEVYPSRHISDLDVRGMALGDIAARIK